MSANHHFDKLAEYIINMKERMQLDGSELLLLGKMDEVRNLLSKIDEIENLQKEVSDLKNKWNKLFPEERKEKYEPISSVDSTGAQSCTDSFLYYKTKLLIPRDDAFRILKGIKNSLFQQGLKTHWTVDDNGYVKAQSVLWLFCWARTTNRSHIQATLAIQKLFVVFFGKDYKWFKDKLEYEYAQMNRNAKKNIEFELIQKLKGL